MAVFGEERDKLDQIGVKDDRHSRGYGSGTLRFHKWNEVLELFEEHFFGHHLELLANVHSELWLGQGRGWCLGEVTHRQSVSLTRLVLGGNTLGKDRNLRNRLRFGYGGDRSSCHTQGDVEGSGAAEPCLGRWSTR
jgi:hypothetical protein